MHNAVVLSQVFPARIAAVEALLQAVQIRNNNTKQLRHAAGELDRVCPLYGRASTAAVYAAIAELLRIVAMQVEWRAAVLDAAVDADRFLRGSKERHRLWLVEYGALVGVTGLVNACAEPRRCEFNRMC